jgi:hypothetical protein
MIIFGRGMNGGVNIWRGSQGFFFVRLTVYA